MSRSQFEKSTKWQTTLDNIFPNRCHFFHSHGTFQPIKHQEGVSWRVTFNEPDF